MPGRPKSFGIAGLMAQPDPMVAAAATARGGGDAGAASSPPRQPAQERRANPGLDSAMRERGLIFVEADGDRVEVGRGAFATAYLAHNAAGKELVVKEVDLTKLSARDRMKAGQEVTFLKGFTHENVVRCLDAFNTYNTLHIVLEYASKGTLQMRIDAAKRDASPFPVDQVLRWFAEICAALDHLHSARVLHRDLKTANVFLDRELRVKLGDFGMSRKLDDEDNLSGGQVGTPYYFAPEVCQKHPYSNKTDMWSAGVVLYEMAMLRRPFEAKSMRGLLKAIQEANYAKLPEDCDPRVAALIGRILVVAQRERPSAHKLIQQPDLACFLPTGEPPAAPARVRRLLTKVKKRDPSKRSSAVRRWVFDVGGLAEREEGRGGEEKHPEEQTPKRRGSERRCSDPSRGAGGAAAPDEEAYEEDFEEPPSDDDEDFYEDDYEDDFEAEFDSDEGREIKQLTDVHSD
eukprot:TRINITY_DN7838_c3_g1_i1.p1 TRINITY_DN7838_c3_g1~~TRINITY_DN7838_c3_g1_i1.p1  ORF type:complete len:460 (+),score=136.65 TRINITY_DN7838_c3_g1_i1:89-1468(+)